MQRRELAPGPAAAGRRRRCPRRTWSAMLGNSTARPSVIERQVEAPHPQGREAHQQADDPAEQQPATGIVASNVQPWSTIRMAAVNAPTPKKAPWPIDTWPLNPVSRLRPMAAIGQVDRLGSSRLYLGLEVERRVQGRGGQHHADDDAGRRAPGRGTGGHRRASPAGSATASGRGAGIGSIGVAGLVGRHQTRSTVRLPNRPLGFTTSTTRMSASGSTTSMPLSGVDVLDGQRRRPRPR